MLAKKKTVRNNRGMEPTRYFIYARKSTRSDDRQKLSIPAQLKALNRLARERGLAIFETVIERESAHVPGRPLFTEMMGRIAAGEAAGVIAWHPNRLARNSTDGGQIIQFLDAGKLKDLKFCNFWFENTPQGRANLGHEFVQSKQYSDSLACDTKRGQLEKAEMGHYPGMAPRGYLNNIATKTIVLDRELAPLIKQAFESYASGRATLQDLRQELARGGLRTGPNRRWRSAGGRPVHVDFVRRLLRNPFYYGHFEYSGLLYEGKHPPIISKQLFDRVQAVRACRTHPMAPVRQPKAFTRLLRCGECRMSVTAEVQKGHVYYRCSRKSRATTCRQPFVREEQLERDISQLLAACSLPEGWGKDMFKRLAAETDQLDKTAEAVLREKNEAITQIGIKQQKLLDSYIEELIDREEFAGQKRKLLTEKKRVQEQISRCERERYPWLEPFKEWIETASSLGKIAETGSRHEKKVLAQKVFGSNLALRDKQAHGKAVERWSLLQNRSPHLTSAQCYDLARKHFVDAC